jgi:putative transposase
VPDRKRLRLATFDYRGIHRYSVTFCTFERRSLFTEEALVNDVLLQIMRAASAQQVAILAYCFMPDHVHMLVAGTRPDSDIRRFLTLAKQLSGYWFKRTHRRSLWQRSAWERVLRAEDNTSATIRYILANPVRAGLVKEPMDYRFSGSLVWSGEALLDAFTNPDARQSG